MVLLRETEPPDSSALTSSRCCGAESGILPVAGSAPRRWARPSALSAAWRGDWAGGAACAAGAAVVEVVEAVDAPPEEAPEEPPEAGVGAVDFAGAVVPASTVR